MRTLALLPLALIAGGCSASEAADTTGGKSAPTPPPRVVMVGPDKPHDGITSAAASRNPARIIAEGGSALQPLGASPPPLPAARNPTPQEQFATDCQRYSAQVIPEIERRYRMAIARGVARISRSAWDKMDAHQRAALHWPLAYSASCPLGRRAIHRIRVVDESGRELAFQMISTELECHGDHAFIRPEDTEYLC